MWMCADPRYRTTVSLSIHGSRGMRGNCATGSRDARSTRISFFTEVKKIDRTGKYMVRGEELFDLENVRKIKIFKICKFVGLRVGFLFLRSKNCYIWRTPKNTVWRERLACPKCFFSRITVSHVSHSWCPVKSMVSS